MQLIKIQKSIDLDSIICWVDDFWNELLIDAITIEYHIQRQIDILLQIGDNCKS